MIPGFIFSSHEWVLAHSVLTNTEGNVLGACMSPDGTRAFITTSNGKLISYGKTAGVWTKRTTYTLPNLPLKYASVAMSSSYSYLVVAAVTDDGAERGQLNFFSYNTGTDTFTLDLDLSRNTWATATRTATQSPVSVSPDGTTVLMHATLGGFPRREIVTRPSGPTSWTGLALTVIYPGNASAMCASDTAYVQDNLAGTVLRITGIFSRTPVTQATYTRSGGTTSYGGSISASQDGTRVAITDTGTSGGYVEVRHSDTIVFSMVGTNLPMQAGGDFIAGAATLSADGTMLIVPASLVAVSGEITGLHFYLWNGSAYVYQYTYQVTSGGSYLPIASADVQGQLLRTSSNGRATLGVFGNTLRFFTI